MDTTIADKCKSLIINGWVLIGDSDNYRGYIGRVKAINALTGYCIVAVAIDDKLYHNTEVFIDDILPIELTEEILLFNGWRKCLNLSEFYNSNCWFDVRLSSRPVNVNFNTSSKRVIWTLKSVSSLQHVLKICGYHDEADNFQVPPFCSIFYGQYNKYDPYTKIPLNSPV